MSKNKLYAVKNDEGKYWDFNDLDGFWESIRASCPITVSEEYTKNEAKEQGGHVVTLIEEPEKIVLPKDVADELEIAKECKDSFDVYIMRIINGLTTYENSHVFWKIGRAHV